MTIVRPEYVAIFKKYHDKYGDCISRGQARCKEFIKEVETLLLHVDKDEKIFTEKASKYLNDVLKKLPDAKEKYVDDFVKNDNLIRYIDDMKAHAWIVKNLMRDDKEASEARKSKGYFDCYTPLGDLVSKLKLLYNDFPKQQAALDQLFCDLNIKIDGLKIEEQHHPQLIEQNEEEGGMLLEIIDRLKITEEHQKQANREKDAQLDEVTTKCDNLAIGNYTLKSENMTLIAKDVEKTAKIEQYEDKFAHLKGYFVELMTYHHNPSQENEANFI